MQIDPTSQKENIKCHIYKLWDCNSLKNETETYKKIYDNMDSYFNAIMKRDSENRNIIKDINTLRYTFNYAKCIRIFIKNTK